ncbi:monofunctional biosynthetic peptidoglycan transglycosylase [Thalassovita mediterranea]|jgi:monofunctional biosynthetic peptidoglycan transglycosylase|uniref:Biosynthetic peptidoglycan transglycosylase n=1 Tax=Thalassovita mediterranea TaxID=340021 RepID=A0A0P1GR02_9RHOB|nr:monofunctional biosynthetic peptidoglycan transglycosylase [Thalassovita mediterranea]CUH85064.1 Penicillin-binding protein 1A/1B [Thalassovita mediterranea]SIS35132.1 monofunctional biosynthetic peptidoglycan transglycosylase [Thalassovita mediterranea]
MAKGKKQDVQEMGLWRRFKRIVYFKILRLFGRVLRVAMYLAALMVLWVASYSLINPPSTIYIQQEKARLGSVKREWVPIDQIAPVMLRSVVAAEDANFCAHWGFDMQAIRAAIAAGGQRGGSTLTQQVVKNAHLWHGRNYVRKTMEASLTPFVELFWSKRRILEVYLNIAEFDEGVFGVGAAAQHYFGVGAAELSAVQAARLAAILPSPKSRSAIRPAEFTRRQAARILDGAETIRRDGRAACFED